MTLYDFLYFNAKINGMDEKTIKVKINEIVDFLELKKFLKGKPINFSSGEQKKCLLAQGLLKDSDIFIMDEPASNLDPKNRLSLFEKLKMLQIERKKTIFISSHILDELDQYVDSVTIIEKGKIQISGDIKIIKDTFLNSQLEFQFQALDQKLLTNFLFSSKINFNEKEGKTIIRFNSNNDYETFLKKAYSNQIIFKEIIGSVVSLKDIYSTYNKK